MFPQTQIRGLVGAASKRGPGRAGPTTKNICLEISVGRAAYKPSQDQGREGMWKGPDKRLRRQGQLEDSVHSGCHGEEGPWVEAAP